MITKSLAQLDPSLIHSISPLRTPELGFHMVYMVYLPTRPTFKSSAQTSLLPSITNMLQTELCPLLPVEGHWLPAAQAKSIIICDSSLSSPT